ncbi:unnamed protein product [Pleuronectes platessa]|uniref:Uncharacterized protein n=1 Tax=Pleuronectes platessa TaxID=8262 RepID=A0A9N7UMZ5_PLEPL|nr:unnamed protein product [Pleuronectes platessa]
MNMQTNWKVEEEEGEEDVVVVVVTEESACIAVLITNGSLCWGRVSFTVSSESDSSSALGAVWWFSVLLEDTWGIETPDKTTVLTSDEEEVFMSLKIPRLHHLKALTSITHVVSSPVDPFSLSLSLSCSSVRPSNHPSIHPPFPLSLLRPSPLSFINAAEIDAGDNGGWTCRAPVKVVRVLRRGADTTGRMRGGGESGDELMTSEGRR